MACFYSVTVWHIKISGTVVVSFFCHRSVRARMFAARPPNDPGAIFLWSPEINMCVEKVCKSRQRKTLRDGSLEHYAELRLERRSGEAIIKVKLGAITSFKATYNHHKTFFFSIRLLSRSNCHQSQLLWKVSFAPLRSVFFDVWRVACVVFCDVGNLSEVICGQFAMELFSFIRFHWQLRRKCSDVSGLKMLHYELKFRGQ